MKIYFTFNQIKGNSNTNSTSKITKIMASKKKFKENLLRLVNLGENPHSYAILFSYSIFIFFDTKAPSNPRTPQNKNLRIIINIIIFI